MQDNTHATPEDSTAEVGTPSYTNEQSQLFDISFKAAIAIDKLVRVQLKPLTQWLQEQYGDTMPTYEQFWSDRAALEALAKVRGLADDQTVRKPYNMAVKQRYGALPVSPSEAAVAKRAARATLTLPNKAKQTPAAPTTAPVQASPAPLTHPSIQLPEEGEGWEGPAYENDDLDTIANNAAVVAAARASTSQGQSTAAESEPAAAITAPSAEAAVRQLLVDYGFAQTLMAFSIVLAEHTETAKEAKRVAQLGQQYEFTHPEEARQGGDRRANGMH